MNSQHESSPSTCERGSSSFNGLARTALMPIPERKRTCFVIMPFGEKKDCDGRDIDFDDIYRHFFKKAIEELAIDCIRCDEIQEAGSIHDMMFKQIYEADAGQSHQALTASASACMSVEENSWLCSLAR